MQYAVVTSTGALQRLGDRVVEWAGNILCAAKSLTDEQRAAFNVVEYRETPQPAYNSYTHICQDAGQELIGGIAMQIWAVSPRLLSDILAGLAAAMTQLINQTAASKGYGDMTTSPALSIISYENDPNPSFAAEAAAFKLWRSSLWTAYLGIQSGSSPMPNSVVEFTASLPAINWPAV